jgi:CheY-like chemotaxis protein
MDKKRAMAMGIRAFVYKPVLKREIAKAIRQVLDSQEEKAEQPLARILVIDDDVQVREMLHQLLARV